MRERVTDTPQAVPQPTHTHTHTREKQRNLIAWLVGQLTRARVAPQRMQQDFAVWHFAWSPKGDAPYVICAKMPRTALITQQDDGIIVWRRITQGRLRSFLPTCYDHVLSIKLRWRLRRVFFWSRVEYLSALPEIIHLNQLKYFICILTSLFSAFN